MRKAIVAAIALAGFASVSPASAANTGWNFFGGVGQVTGGNGGQKAFGNVYA